MPRKEFKSRLREHRTENNLLENLEKKETALALLDEIWPNVEQMARHGNVSGMLKAYAPLAVLRLMDLAKNAQSEKVRASAAEALMVQQIGKPVQANVTLTKDFSAMEEKELNALLKSTLKEIGVDGKPLLQETIKTEVKEDDKKNEGYDS